jgi:hypothetical protein
MAYKKCLLLVNRASKLVLFVLEFHMYKQHTSFNLTSNNLEILIVRHLRTAIPRPEILFVTRKKSFIDETGLSHRHVQKGLEEGLYINHSCVPCPPVSYSTCFSNEDPENTKEAPDNPRQAVEGDI